MEKVERLEFIARQCRDLADRSSGWSAENLRALAREFDQRAAEARTRREIVDSHTAG